MTKNVKLISWSNFFFLMGSMKIGNSVEAIIMFYCDKAHNSHKNYRFCLQLLSSVSMKSILLFKYVLSLVIMKSNWYLISSQLPISV